MFAVPRRVVLVAVLVALVAATAVQAACPTNCEVCVLGKCMVCKDGYYPTNSTCASCEAAHCKRCSAMGMCTSCESGYHVTYTNQTVNGTDINLWGICRANAATGALSVRRVAAVLVLTVTAFFMAL